MQSFTRLTGILEAVPNSSNMDIRFALSVENAGPLLCVANTSATAQIASGLGSALRMLNTGLAFQGSENRVPDPLSDQEALAGWRQTAAQTAFALLGLQGFATEIVRHVLRGGALNDAEFAKLMEISIRNMKNFDVAGMAIEQEAEIIGKAIENLKNSMNAIIAQGRDLK